MISEESRVRTNPRLPVRQNLHPKAQPTWVERQRVKWFFSGSRTLSIFNPSSNRKRYFFVPSDEVFTSAGSKKLIQALSSNFCRKALATLVIAAKWRAPRPYNHLASRLA